MFLYIISTIFQDIKKTFPVVFCRRPTLNIVKLMNLLHYSLLICESVDKNICGRLSQFTYATQCAIARGGQVEDYRGTWAVHMVDCCSKLFYVVCKFSRRASWQTCGWILIDLETEGYNRDFLLYKTLATDNTTRFRRKMEGRRMYRGVHRRACLKENNRTNRSNNTHRPVEKFTLIVTPFWTNLYTRTYCYH